MTRWLLFCCLLMPINIIAANFHHEKVDQLISADQPPDGVVFELMSWEDNSWDWAVPMLEQFIAQLQDRFSDLDVALISHGAEMFDLSRKADKATQPVFQRLAALQRQGLEIHVDAAYAKYKRLGVNDFLDFVDVPDSSDAQLENYLQLGFVPIRLEQPDALD